MEREGEERGGEKGEREREGEGERGKGERKREKTRRGRETQKEERRESYVEFNEEILHMYDDNAITKHVP